MRVNAYDKHDRLRQWCWRPPFAVVEPGGLGLGGAAPVYSGSVVDRKRMNRILDVNDKTHYAVVKPGASYFDLYRYIQEHKLNLWRR